MALNKKLFLLYLCLEKAKDLKNQPPVRLIPASPERTKIKTQILLPQKKPFYFGQGLVEYLVLTCLLAVASITAISILGKNIREQYANLSSALRGGTAISTTPADPSVYMERGMNDFMQGAKKSGWGGEIPR